MRLDRQLLQPLEQADAVDRAGGAGDADDEPLGHESSATPWGT